MSQQEDVAAALNVLMEVNASNRDLALSEAASRLAMAIERAQWEDAGNSGQFRSGLRIVIRKSDFGPMDPDPARSFALSAIKAADSIKLNEAKTPAFQAVQDYEACRAAGTKPLICMVALVIALSSLIRPFAARR